MIVCVFAVLGVTFYRQMRYIGNEYILIMDRHVLDSEVKKAVLDELNLSSERIVKFNEDYINSKKKEQQRKNLLYALAVIVIIGLLLFIGRNDIADTLKKAK